MTVVGVSLVQCRASLSCDDIVRDPVYVRVLGDLALVLPVVRSWDACAFGMQLAHRRWVVFVVWCIWTEATSQTPTLARLDGMPE